MPISSLFAKVEPLLKQYGGVFVVVIGAGAGVSYFIRAIKKANQHIKHAFAIFSGGLVGSIVSVPMTYGIHHLIQKYTNKDFPYREIFAVAIPVLSILGVEIGKVYKDTPDKPQVSIKSSPIIDPFILVTSEQDLVNIDNPHLIESGLSGILPKRRRKI